MLRHQPMQVHFHRTWPLISRLLAHSLLVVFLREDICFILSTIAEMNLMSPLMSQATNQIQMSPFLNIAGLSISNSIIPAIIYLRLHIGFKNLILQPLFGDIRTPEFRIAKEQFRTVSIHSRYQTMPSIITLITAELS